MGGFIKMLPRVKTLRIAFRCSQTMWSVPTLTPEEPWSTEKLLLDSPESVFLFKQPDLFHYMSRLATLRVYSLVDLLVFLPHLPPSVRSLEAWDHRIKPSLEEELFCRISFVPHVQSFTYLQIGPFNDFWSCLHAGQNGILPVAPRSLERIKNLRKALIRENGTRILLEWREAPAFIAQEGVGKAL